MNPGTISDDDISDTDLILTRSLNLYECLLKFNIEYRLVIFIIYTYFHRKLNRVVER